MGKELTWMPRQCFCSTVAAALSCTKAFGSASSNNASILPYRSQVTQKPTTLETLLSQAWVCADVHVCTGCTMFAWDKLGTFCIKNGSLYSESLHHHYNIVKATFDLSMHRSQEGI